MRSPPVIGPMTDPARADRERPETRGPGQGAGKGSTE
jgi:hypothetical protein